MNENTKVNYIEMPFRQFAAMFPDVVASLPLPLEMLLADPKYIIRLKDGRVEVGYTEDAWCIR